LILVSADRAKDFPRKPVYLIGTGESVETAMVAPLVIPAKEPQGFHRLPWPPACAGVTYHVPAVAA
jgi:hypothetical protein